MLHFRRQWVFALLLFVNLSSFAQAREGENYALVIIDMQPHFSERGGNSKDPGNVRKVNELLNNQIKLINLAKNQKIPIIFIEYQNLGETFPKLKMTAAGHDNIRTFTKTTDGMFNDSNTEKRKLEDYLKSKKIGNLIIAGANGGGCVSESINGLLQSNYNVLAYSKGIADFNARNFIYPYDNLLKFNPACKSCSFREIDEYETIALALASRKTRSSVAQINDSDRGLIKDVIIKDKKKKEPKAGATVQ